MNWLKKLVALVTMLIVVWAALSLGSTPDVWALLVRVLIIAGLLAVVPVRPPNTDPELPATRFVTVLASRAPPFF